MTCQVDWIQNPLLDTPLGISDEVVFRARDLNKKRKSTLIVVTPFHGLGSRLNEGPSQEQCFSAS